MNNPNPVVYNLEEREIDGATDPLIVEIFGKQIVQITYCVGWGFMQWGGGRQITMCEHMVPPS